jgi:hypothetical protein
VTTDRFDETKDGIDVNNNGVVSQIGRSRLWAITFDDVADPLKGGKIELLLDGTEPQQMFDNLTVDADGNVYVQEDVGNNPHNSKIWVYNPKTGALIALHKHDPVRFGDFNQPATLIQNEESSGIIDVTDLFKDTSWYIGGRIFLADVQAHYDIPGELVEGGQLLLLQVVPEPSTAVLLVSGLVGVILIRRRQQSAATPLA